MCYCFISLLAQRINAACEKDKINSLLIERRGFNKAAVALANKNARIIWALATGSGEYAAQVA